MPVLVHVQLIHETRQDLKDQGLLKLSDGLEVLLVLHIEQVVVLAQYREYVLRHEQSCRHTCVGAWSLCRYMCAAA